MRMSRVISPQPPGERHIPSRIHRPRAGSRAACGRAVHLPEDDGFTPEGATASPAEPSMRDHAGAITPRGKGGLGWRGRPDA